MARGKDTLSEKVLSIVTVRDVLVLAKHAKIEGSNGAKEDAIVKALFNAKIPAELAENINGKRKKSDNGDSDTSDSDKNSETSDAKSKKKKRTKKTPDSDKSDSCSDSDDLAVMARHTGIDHRVSEGLGRDGGRPLSFPFLWIYMFITEPQHFFVLRKPGSFLPGRLYRRLAFDVGDAVSRALGLRNLEHLITAHELCAAAKTSSADKAGKFSWTFFWRCYGDRVERWGEHIS